MIMYSSTLCEHYESSAQLQVSQASSDPPITLDYLLQLSDSPFGLLPRTSAALFTI